jgi:hypothetical protein
LAKKWRFIAKNTASGLSKHWFIIKTAFLAENCQKLQKIVIITSTPGGNRPQKRIA